MESDLLKLTGIEAVTRSPNSNLINMVEFLRRAAEQKTGLRFLRIGAPAQFRLAVIELIESQREKLNEVCRLLIDPSIKHIEFLLADTFAPPFLRRLDAEGKTNWSIWRSQNQILQFVRGLLQLKKFRKPSPESLMIAFHRSELLWQLNILGNHSVLMRSYGERGTGHDDSTPEVFLKSGGDALLLESMIGYYESVRQAPDTFWIDSEAELDAYITTNDWPNLYKANAIAAAESFSAEEKRLIPHWEDVFCKVCRQKTSHQAESQWIDLNQPYRRSSVFFHIPTFHDLIDIPWRGKALVMERVGEFSVFELATELHRQAKMDRKKQGQAEKMLGLLIHYSLFSLREFKRLGHEAFRNRPPNPYPYADNVVSALEQVFPFFAPCSSTLFAPVASEIRRLGIGIEKMANTPFRDAHYKNRIYRSNGETIAQVVDRLMSMEKEAILNDLQTKITEIDFEHSQFDVTEWDDIIHILFFENSGLSPIKHDIDAASEIVKWLGIPLLTPAEENLMWRTMLARATREFCRRLWYARVMPKTYYHRYNSESRDYYLDLAIYAGEKCGGLVCLRNLLKWCKNRGDMLWGSLVPPQLSIEWVHAAYQEGIQEDLGETKVGQTKKERRPFKVFISSTFIDNQERRRVVEESIRYADMIPIGMERFLSSSQLTIEECKCMVANCDLFVGIIAHRYGTIPDKHEISITELEYDAAVRMNRLMFLIDDSIPVRLESDLDSGPDRWEKQKKLQGFRERICKELTPAYFKETTLSGLVVASLERWRLSKEGPR
jgi:hypothetical protein